MDETNYRKNLMIQVADLFGEHAMVLDSSEWTKDVSYLNQAVEWLGYDKACSFHDVLEFNTKADKKGQGYRHGKTKLNNIHPDCRYLVSNI